jgi:hypothetical protein
MKRLILMLYAVASLTATLSAADITGEWELELKPDFGGTDDVRGCSFQQQDEKLAANCGGGPNIFGDVRGHAVTFVVKTGPKQEYAATFTGTLDQKATTISGVWTITDQSGKREGKFTLRKH